MEHRGTQTKPLVQKEISLQMAITPVIIIVSFPSHLQHIAAKEANYLHRLSPETKGGL